MYTVDLTLFVEWVRVISDATIKTTLSQKVNSGFTSETYRNLFLVSSIMTATLAGLALYKGKKKAGYTALSLAIGQGFIGSGFYKTIKETYWLKEGPVVSLCSGIVVLAGSLAMPIFLRLAENPVNRAVAYCYHHIINR